MDRTKDANNIITVDELKAILRREFAKNEMVTEALIVNFENDVTFAMVGTQRKDHYLFTTSIIKKGMVVVSISTTRPVGFQRAIDDGMLELLAELINEKGEDCEKAE